LTPVDPDAGGHRLNDAASEPRADVSVSEATGGNFRLGVIGSFVWDIIYGRGGRELPVEEHGGITYALGALDAALPRDWEFVPLVKVGSDLVQQARQYMRTLKRIAPDAAPIEVPYPNNRVELHYYSDQRRSEIMSGGVPPWTWAGLQPLLHDLDALHVNLISGFELDLETAQLLRQHFRGPIYCDLHSLVLAIGADGARSLRPLAHVADWMSCFDFIQVNEDEVSMMASDPMELAAIAMANGVKSLVVTLGERGAVYFATPGLRTLADSGRPLHRSGSATPPKPDFGPVRTELLPAHAPPNDEIVDPTGCGDVWGATYFARLLAGDSLTVAMRAAHRAAALNVAHRGATGLAAYLRGELSLS